MYIIKSKQRCTQNSLLLLDCLKDFLFSPHTYDPISFSQDLLCHEHDVLWIWVSTHSQRQFLFLDDFCFYRSISKLILQSLWLILSMDFNNIHLIIEFISCFSIWNILFSFVISLPEFYFKMFKCVILLFNLKVVEKVFRMRENLISFCTSLTSCIHSFQFVLVTHIYNYTMRNYNYT